MAVGTVESRIYSFHPALEGVQALDLLRGLQKDYPGSTIEGCMPDYLPPDDLRMRLASLTKTILNKTILNGKDYFGLRDRAVDFSNQLSSFLENHSLIRGLALSSIVREDQGTFGSIKGVVLVAKDSNRVDVFVTDQDSGTWIGHRDLVFLNSDALSSLARGVTPIPAYLPKNTLESSQLFWDMGIKGYVVTLP